MTPEERSYVKALRAEAIARRKEAAAQFDMAAAQDHLADVIEAEDTAD